MPRVARTKWQLRPQNNVSLKILWFKSVRFVRNLKILSFFLWTRHMKYLCLSHFQGWFRIPGQFKTISYYVAVIVARLFTNEWRIKQMPQHKTLPITNVTCKGEIVQVWTTTFNLQIMSVLNCMQHNDIKFLLWSTYGKYDIIVKYL